MEPACKEALDRALEILTENLQVEPALIHLQSKGYVSEYVANEIRQKTSETEKCRVFVGKLKTCGQAAYDAFKTYLSTTPGQAYLGDLLPEFNADKVSIYLTFIEDIDDVTYIQVENNFIG